MIVHGRLCRSHVLTMFQHPTRYSHSLIPTTGLFFFEVLIPRELDTNRWYEWSQGRAEKLGYLDRRDDAGARGDQPPGIDQSNISDPTIGLKVRQRVYATECNMHWQKSATTHA